MSATTVPTAIYDAETFKPRESVSYLLGRVKVELMTALDQEFARDSELAALEVTAAQYSILSALALGQADSASQLCKGISYDAGAMTRMLDRLEAKGVVSRSRCPEDRRLVKLELTAIGRAAVPRMWACAVEVLNRFLRGFTRAEVHELQGYLHRMLENA